MLKAQKLSAESPLQLTPVTCWPHLSFVIIFFPHVACLLHFITIAYSIQLLRLFIRCPRKKTCSALMGFARVTHGINALGITPVNTTGTLKYSIVSLRKHTLVLNRVFVLDVIGCHADVQVVPMIVIYQEKILFTYFDFNSFTSIINIKLMKFQGSAHLSFACSCKNLHCWYDHRITPFAKEIRQIIVCCSNCYSFVWQHLQSN